MTNPFEHHKRGSMTPQRRARIFAQNGSRCGWIKAGIKQGCDRKLTARDIWRVEHGDALELGGTDDDSGLGISCEWCWPEKDAEDHADAGHLRRGFTKHVVPKAFMRSRSWGRR
jgi:hypothetical protein